MNKSDLSIATITWVRDEQEELLLRASLEQLAKFEIPVYITDGGSNTGFLDFLGSFSNFTLFEPKEKGLWAQAKNSLSEAYRMGSEFILYTEPDKQNFFQEGLARFVEEASLDKEPGIVLACRSAAGFVTFPVFQRMSETTINNCCKEVIGHRFDYTYGPFILNRQLVPYLEIVNEDIGWGWRPYTFGICHRLGYRVDAFIGDFLCPAAQQQDTPAERLYRMRQLIQSIQGLLLSTSIALDKVEQK